MWGLAGALATRVIRNALHRKECSVGIGKTVASPEYRLNAPSIASLWSLGLVGCSEILYGKLHKATHNFNGVGKNGKNGLFMSILKTKSACLQFRQILRVRMCL